MESEIYINKDRQLLPSQDFQYLFDTGLSYIQSLGSKFWTDYNTHDPGIAILDVLCYAITELGYRTDFDIKDILTNAEGVIDNKTFFKASAIFTNAPLTCNDYRKLLIDIDGVENAWYQATKKTTDASGYYLPNDAEAKVYINKLEDKLSLKNKDNKNNLLPELKIRGLAKVKIELEDDPVLGDLNTLVFEYAFWKNNRWVKVKIAPQFLDWNDPLASLFAKMDTPSKITIESVKKLDDIVYAIVNRYSKPTDSLHFRIFPEDKREMDLIVQHFGLEKNICEIISKFEQKRKKIQGVFSEVILKLHQNRNFTEDYLCTQIIEKVEIAICADIELEPGYDVVEVMSKVQIAIDKIISPKIYFYTLNQLVNEGYHSEDIFLGPKLTHGFIKEEELDKAELPKEIHASDIIAELMTVKGVHSVKNLMMTAYNQLGKPISGAINQSWVLTLSGELKPVFNADLSKLLLFQKNIPFLLSENQQMLVDQKVIMYKSRLHQKKLKNIHNDYVIEDGTHYDLDDYYSIQDDFPINYGIGKNSLSENESAERLGQTKQLKGYLYFYEQIIADFFSQLYNANSLLDITPIKQSYFPRYLETNDLTGEEFYSKFLYTDELKEQILYDLDINQFSIYESKDLFYERRNKALDHLMARFAESFNDYVFMMYQVTQDTSGMGEMSFDYKDLINDKESFLTSYPEISSKRGLGIDYLNLTIDNQTKALTFNSFWNTDHRGGYEKRVAKLLGIGEISLRDIVTEETPQTQWTVEIATNKIFLFKIISPNVDLVEKWDWAQLHFLDQNLYKIELTSGKYVLYLMNENKKIARLDQKFDTSDKAYEFLEAMIRDLNLYYENFYCIEHALLRPISTNFWTDDDLLTVCLNDDCFDPVNNDPYSFKATIVLPGYLSRFKNLIFRKYADKVFRQEAPAHVLLKVCWVNTSDMLKFQKAYKNWIEHYGKYRFKFCNNTLKNNDLQNYHLYLKELILALKELNTLYPEGNLYDCQISEKNNPIILGSTSLGTL